jgi:hypothetical protein
MKHVAACLLLGLVLLLLTGCAEENSPIVSMPSSISADREDADVATAWFGLSCTLIQQSRLSPPVASRMLGYEGVALYEAVRPGTADHVSLIGQLSDLTYMPQPDARAEYYWPAVANSAMATLLRNFFASGPAAAMDSINRLDQTLQTAFQAAVPSDVLQRSDEMGRLIAVAVFEWSLSDGYLENNNCSYTAPQGAGLWVPTPPAYAAPLQPCWGRLRTFLPDDGPNSCQTPPPPAYSTDTASAFFAEALECYSTCLHATTEQHTIAIYWADNAGESATPPGHSISILNQLVRRDHVNLAVAAEAYARVGIAVADAFIVCWRTKYQFNLLRPVTFVRATIDSTWLPMIPTPPFPEYTSGHSVQSGAAAEVLADLFGERAFVDSTNVPRGMAPRTFESFDAWAGEAGISRLYAGIHFRAAIENGLEQGRCIGRHAGALVLRQPS